MPLAPLLLVSTAVFAALGVVLYLEPALRRTLFRGRVVLSALVLSAVLSAGSAVVRAADASGTGIRVRYGFPKPFYFTWQSWEHPAPPSSELDALYFAGNYVAWLAVVAAAAVLWAALRARPAASR